MAARQLASAAELVLREDCYGLATQRLCYPRVSSCVTVSVVSAAGVSGFHMHVRSTDAEIATAFTFLRGEGGGTGATRVHVVGNLRDFPRATVSQLKGRERIERKLRQEVSAGAQLLFFNVERNLPGQENHIFVEVGDGDPVVSYCNSSAGIVSGFEFPAGFDTTAIEPRMFKGISLRKRLKERLQATFR